MKEIKCPKCGTVITVDDADFAALLSQVRTEEFNVEVERRIKQLSELQEAKDAEKAAKEAARHKEELSGKDQTISQKDGEIARLKEQITAMGDQQKLAVGKAMADKDKEIAELKASLSQKESEIQIAVLKEQQKTQESLQSKDAVIAQLRRLPFASPVSVPNWKESFSSPSPRRPCRRRAFARIMNPS